MNQAPSSVSSVTALRWARDWLGDAVEATPLYGEYDLNFRITDERGERYVLKVARDARESTRVAAEFQLAALEHLASSDARHLVPAPRRSATGERFGIRRDDAGDERLVVVLRWIDGAILDEVAYPSDGLLENIGAAVARVDRALESFDHPGAHRELEWDLRRFLAHRSELRLVDDDERRALLATRLDRFELHVLARLERCRRGTIHNDGGNQHNMIADRSPGTDDHHIVGIIDFGDAIHTAVVCGLGVAAAYATFGRPDPLHAIERVVTGYHGIRELSSEEIELVPDLAGARLATSALVAARRASSRPGDPYAAVSAAEAWHSLFRLRSLDLAREGERLRDRLLGARPRTPFEDLGRPPRAGWHARSAGGSLSGRTRVDHHEASDRLLGRETTSDAPAATTPRDDTAAIAAVRARHFGRGLSLSYRKPLTIVRGRGAHLWDQEGRRYTDCVNNVCHVGHAHPSVVRAAAQQKAEIETNSRYLHPVRARYLEALAAKFPAPLEVIYLVCTGSEAVDLALRIARTVTVAEDVIALAGAYHGNSRAAIDVSEYKFGGPGGAGRPPTTHLVAAPDTYRGAHRDRTTAGALYATEVEAAVERLAREGRRPAAFIAESMLGVGGQIDLPSGYLARAYEAVRDAGGIAIADEVQTGFGRVGDGFWAFEAQGVVPDIVTLGKPMGNGHPIGGVVTTRAIAEAFDNGMEYFNTFGGNPVSCAVGLEVLRVIEREGLQEHAARLGGHLLGELRSLRSRHAIVGDVRGRGLFLGIELVRDRSTLEPADREAREVVERMRERGVLLSVDGPLHDVIKIKPPLAITRTDVDTLVDALDEELGRLGTAG